MTAESLATSGSLLDSLKNAAEIHKKCTDGVIKDFEKVPAKLQKEKLKALSFNRFTAYKKALENSGEELSAMIQGYIVVLQEADWLIEKFGIEGEYSDIPGLCKIASISEIEEKNWSLTPGAYVGVAEVHDDGVDFAARMQEIHAELLTLQQQSNELMDKITANFKELGI